MANRSLGFITVTSAGTPVQVTKIPTLAHAYMVQQTVVTGAIGYVGGAGMVKATGVGVFGIVPPASASTLPAFSSTTTVRENPFDMSDIWLDTATDGAVYLVSYIYVDRERITW